MCLALAETTDLEDFHVELREIVVSEIVKISSRRSAGTYSGSMDWWCTECPCSQSETYFSEAEIFQKIPSDSAGRAIFAKFQPPTFEI